MQTRIEPNSKGLRSRQASQRNQEQSSVTPSELWPPRVVANVAGFRSTVSILRAFRAGRLPGYKFGKRVVRFHPDDVKRWMDAARVGGKGEAQ